MCTLRANSNHTFSYTGSVKGFSIFYLCTVGHLTPVEIGGYASNTRQRTSITCTWRRAHVKNKINFTEQYTQ